jgi:cytoskeletal protein CcmA (bactofilin family)
MSLFGGRRREEAAGRSGQAREAATGTPFTRAGAAGPPRSATSPGGQTAMANIGKSISIKGDLTGNEDIVIEGSVEGKVDLPAGQLTIGSNGTVKGEIQAKSVVIVGRVRGNVTSSERVEIQGTGIVEGDVSAPRLVVAEGAAINGSIQMGQPEATRAPAGPPTAGSDVARAG